MNTINTILPLLLISSASLSFAADTPTAGSTKVPTQSQQQTPLTEAETKKLAEAEAKDLAKKEAEIDIEAKLDSFGFGPALYAIYYDSDILKDTGDVTTKGDGTIGASGSRYATSFGVELHYDISFGRSIKCYSGDCTDKKNYKLQTGHRISPFLGFFDLDNGINGATVGLIYGYWKGDIDSEENKTTLNIGIGRSIHKDQLVLSNGVSENKAPPAGLNTEDFTERKDVKGWTIMVSTNMGF